MNVKFEFPFIKKHINLVNAAKHILMYQLLPTLSRKVDILYAILKLARVASGQKRSKS